MSNCYTCRDKGLIDGCPDCGKILNIFKVEPSTESLRDSKVFIPEFYRNKIWSKEIAKTGKSDTSSSLNFFNMLEYLHIGIMNGKQLSNSAIVSAPATFSKTTWVYSCLKNLITQNKKVAPYISTSEYLRLYNMDVNKPYMQYKYLDFTITEYNMADVLFVEIPDDEAYMFAYETILKILNIRSKLDKPTIFVTNVPLSKIVARDTTGTLIRYLTYEGEGNPYKYLASIQYEEIKEGE